LILVAPFPWRYSQYSPRNALGRCPEELAVSLPARVLYLREKTAPATPLRAMPMPRGESVGGDLLAASVFVEGKGRLGR
jgi:hypothetical protein